MYFAVTCILIRPIHVIHSFESDSDSKISKPSRNKHKIQPLQQSTSHNKYEFPNVYKQLTSMRLLTYIYRYRHNRVTSDSEMDSPNKLKAHRKSGYLSDCHEH